MSNFGLSIVPGESAVGGNIRAVLGREIEDPSALTCTIITGEPNELIREIHTRMPVILPEDKLDVWLSGEAGKEILVPYPANEMMVWPISPRVNSRKNDDPEISEPFAVNAQACRSDAHTPQERVLHNRTDRS